VFIAFVLQLMATVGTTVFLPQFITSQYGYSFSVASVAITPESTASFYDSALLLTAGIVQLGTGELVDRYDPPESPHRIPRGECSRAGGFRHGRLLAARAVRGSPPPPGISLWGLNPARDAIVADIMPAEQEGRTFGYLWTGGLLVASGFPAVIGYIGDVVGLRQAFLVIAGLVLLSTVPIVLLLSERVYLAPERDA